MKFIKRGILLLVLMVSVVSGGMDIGLDTNANNAINLGELTSSIRTFLGLTDSPASYATQAGNCVKVNAGETGLEFGVCAGAAAGDKWIDTGSFIEPNGTFAENIRVDIIEADDWGNVSITESQISDLTHTTLTNLFDQFLNITSNVTFNRVNATDWGNVSITESQISDLTHTTDTNASTICSGDEVLLGNASCSSSGAFFDDTTIADTNASSICSGDEVLLGNTSCSSSGEFFDDTTIPDTNASTACSPGEYLDGSGACIVFNSTVRDLSLNQTETDLIYLNLSGTNANQNLDIGIYNLTLGNKITFVLGPFIEAISSTVVKLTGNLTVTENISADNFIGNLSADFVGIALGGGSPTVDQLQEYLDNTGSSGFFLGGALSDGGAGTLDVAAGEGFIRTTNDDNAELQSFKWSASTGIAVADNTTQYVYVDDAGTISLSTNEFLEAPDLIKIGVVTDELGAIESTFSLGVRLEESIAEAGRFIRRVHGISRDVRRGGLIFGQSGDANRDVTMTTGSLWWGRTEYTMSAFDTSGADTFTTYSANGQEDTVASQFPNTQYDNAGTLTTMTNNRWANLYFYIEPDDHILMVYGRAEFVTAGQAEEESVPSTSLPSRITETSILAARFTFQKSANTASVASAFDTVFSNSVVTDHGNLAGLTDDDHPQYLLTDGTRNITGNAQGDPGVNASFNWFFGKLNWSDIQNAPSFLLTIPNRFDQELNTTDNVVFNSVNSSDWGNVSITESQVSDLVHTVDTNLSQGGNVNGTLNVTTNIIGYQNFSLNNGTDFKTEYWNGSCYVEEWGNNLLAKC